MVIQIKVLQLDLAFEAADRDVVLPVEEVQQFRVMGGKIKGRMMDVDPFVLIKIDDVLHEGLMEVVLNLIDKQIRPSSKRVGDP